LSPSDISTTYEFGRGDREVTSKELAYNVFFNAGDSLMLYRTRAAVSILQKVI
jgi:hypothetical protein